MKDRVVGRVNDGHYEVVYPDGNVMKRMPLDEARSDAKLMAAVERNGWESP